MMTSSFYRLFIYLPSFAVAAGSGSSVSPVSAVSSETKNNDEPNAGQDPYGQNTSALPAEALVLKLSTNVFWRGGLRALLGHVLVLRRDSR